VSYPSGDIGNLKYLRQRAIDLQEKMSRLQDAAPERTEGTDQSGTVRVVIDRDGIPKSIQVGAHWQDKIHPQALKAAIVEASQQATHRRGEVWSRILELSDQSAKSGHNSPSTSYPDSADMGPSPMAFAPRPLGQIADDLLKMLDQVLSSPLPEAQSREVAPDRELTLTLAPGGQLSCTIDAPWASRQSDGQLNQVLGTALNSARQRLRAQEAASNSSSDRLSALSAEIRAVFSEAQRPAERRQV
jgi:DNA-binding protein YbaB